MATIERLKRILRDVLNLGERAAGLTADSLLLGSLPEFDSMAVIAVITTIEDDFGITVEDDEVTADVFESLGTLAAFVDSKAVPA
jgi:acyl carrier protein